MSDFKKVVKIYTEYGSTADMEHLENKLAEFIDDVEGVDDFVCDLEAYICPFKSKKTVERIVSKFVNEDGTKGGHWTYDQAKSVAESHGVSDVNEFYFVLNMMWADYYNPKFGTDEYVKLALQFINDKDAPKDKAARYVRAVVLAN
jgi:hypothetical protein